MANIKLKNNYWVTESIYDTTDSKTQKQVNADLHQDIEDTVIVSDTQPSSDANQIWLPQTIGEGVQVPTWAEHLALSSEISTEASARQLADSALNSALTDEISLRETYVRPNLLDNWYFVGGGSQQGDNKLPINQRGQTVYSGSRSYCIDRWVRRNDGNKDVTVTLQSDGLKFSANDSSENIHGIAQPIENINRFLGKTVTISCLVKDYDDTKKPLNFGIYISNNRANQTSSLGTVVVNGNGLFYRTIQIPVSVNYPYLNVACWSNNDSEMTIIAAKLEIGSSQTLAHRDNNTWVLNEIPVYEEELYNCNTSKADPDDALSYKDNQYIDDTGWVTLTLTSQFKIYGAGAESSRLRYRKIGNIVCIKGIISPTEELGTNAETIVSTVPNELKPDMNCTSVQHGSGMNRFLCSIQTSGNIMIARYGTSGSTAIPAGAWLTINFVYML